MNKMNRPLGTQQGFTLIELIMVIVILGILSAFALPKFADFSDNARVASITAAQGAMKSTAAIAHAQWLADGTNATTATLEGTAYIMVNGYPVVNSAATGIVAMADLSGYTITATNLTGTNGGSVIISNGTATTDRCFTYTGGNTTGPLAATVSALGTMATTTTCT
jgi:MSHA pilin protein MshA